MKIDEVLNLYKLTDNPAPLTGYSDYEKLTDKVSQKIDALDKIRAGLETELKKAIKDPSMFFSFPIKPSPVKMQISNLPKKLLKKIDEYNELSPLHANSYFNDLERKISRDVIGFSFRYLDKPPHIYQANIEINPTTFVWPSSTYEKQYNDLSAILKRNGLKFSKMTWITKRIAQENYRSNSFVVYAGTLNNPKFIWFRNGGIRQEGTSNEVILAPGSANQKRKYLGSFLYMKPNEQDALIMSYKNT
jgi:hypothetical protein